MVISPSTKTYPHVLTHIGYPTNLKADGLDFINGSVPRFEWSKDYSTKVPNFKTDVSGPVASFEWEKSGTYSVALRGTSTNGKSTIKTIDIEVSSHTYKEENITAARFVLMGIPNNILPLQWGDPIKEIGGSIVNNVAHVTAVRTYQAENRFKGYKLLVMLPTVLENPNLYSDLISELNAQLGEPQRRYFGEKDEGCYQI